MTLCKECETPVDLDEPRQCYYTGRGPCGDCEMNCFRPVLCPTHDAVQRLDAMQTSDSEAAHSDADKILLELAGSDVRAAYERLVDRCVWWACA